MTNLLYSILHSEYFVLIVFLIILIIIFKYLMKNKYCPYFYIKDITFTILKDNINNIYIYCSRFENIDEGIHYLYMGKIFINNFNFLVFMRLQETVKRLKFLIMILKTL